ncbi:MAG: hypothetical protein J6T30_04715 [Bacteroidales bacterium]|nr:hypothetical protein [Bacteroidales bacterium]
MWPPNGSQGIDTLYLLADHIGFLKDTDGSSSVWLIAMERISLRGSMSITLEKNR